MPSRCEPNVEGWYLLGVWAETRSGRRPDVRLETGVRDGRTTKRVGTVNDRTVLTVVDEFSASLVSRLQRAGASAGTIATVSEAVTCLRSRIEPFDERLRLDTETAAQLGRRLLAVEHRLDDAMAKAAASQSAIEAARRSVWEFVCRIGQDMRNPLTAVLNLTDILSYGDLTPEQRIMVSEVIRTGEELFVLVDDILVLSRLEARLLPLSIAPVAPADAVDDACQMVKPLADDHGVAVTTVAGDPSVRIRADRYRLAHSLAAILGFAVTSSRPGGEVRIGWTADHDGVRLWVHDNGHGFAAETLASLFDPVGWTSNTSSGGSRLRLVLARRLVEAMHGSIDVASEPGRGSAFELVLGRDTSISG